MAIFFPPVPPVFTGGAQPYGPNHLVFQAVNNPPFSYGGPYAIKLALVCQVQPSPWASNEFLGPNLNPYAPRLLNPSITAVRVDNPPFGLPAQLAVINSGLSQAQPDPWVKIELGPVGGSEPYGQRLLSPAIPGQTVDNPPFANSERRGGYSAQEFAEIKQLWQPNPWVYDFLGGTGGYQPYGPRLMPADKIAVPHDPPPFDRRSFEINAQLIAANQPPVWNFSFEGNRQPYSETFPPVPQQNIVSTLIINLPVNAALAGEQNIKPDKVVSDLRKPKLRLKPIMIPGGFKKFDD